VIGIPTAVLLGSVLFLLLLLLATRSAAAAREISSRSDVPLFDDEAALDPCPPEFVTRIFSPVDWEFVTGTNSRQLQKLFRRERKLVALVWVQQTSTAIRNIMREHTEVTRRSHDLHSATEIKLLAMYAELMLICGMLLLAIRAAGPERVGGLAVYTQTLSQRLAQAQQDFQVVTRDRPFYRAGSA
jgi:hypothetical protein